MRSQFLRTRKLAWFGLLGLLLLGFLFGCKKDKKVFAPGQEWIAHMRGRVEKSIADPDKKTQMLLLVNQMGIEVLRLDQEARKHFANVPKIDRDYNSTPDDFKKQFAEFNAKRYEIRDRVIDASFEMRELATPEEWKDLTDIKEKKGLFKELFSLPGG
jgi:hypothetical protein